ncbi:dTDP-4-amino-4,6-dideoxygalactose transaminase [Planktotalea frisia]|jgi:dTDP-4-amino-4,6-dideoxygalactose transaminase|uniref:Putative pyridoxal phosphate-dependent aminotransferase EpsN n=1 Tax=Planktotalea frisia TaxID=696762 RepID=A0A1L9NTD6_9RHOB|nr:aminotransferase class I/II-fold pyridoxal phosphate-dependent enzyme [Planktotalea frisia]OJI92462.1 putative pyridoxal phosphate-dependent aminotransferase EpsN [Planktotalea frisia]PZX23542.1 dTDP-4-amino-4,6-dideoxygalactose transaminase [Planktotalea frisia]
MIPLAVPNLNGNEAAYLQECIVSTFVSTVGPFVGAFETQIAELSGTTAASVLCSGTTALHLALEGFDIGQGDLVMVPALTFIASANAVRHAGADVWLVDVSAQDWMLDVDAARVAIEAQTDAHPNGRLHRESGKVLRAIMPVMIMGSVPDFAALVAMAKDFNLRVIVDAAAAIGTTYKNGIALGATGVDAVCYSFNGNKTVTCGGGGGVASNDDAYIERIKHLSSTGRVGANYDHDIVAYNYRMTNLQAAVGVAQLERVDAFLASKKKIRDIYSELSSNFKSLEPFPEPAYGQNGYWFSGVYYTGGDKNVDLEFQKHMKSAGIDLRPFWKPLHLQKPYASSLCEPMPVTDDIWKRIFPLPCSTHISDQDLNKIIRDTTNFWNKHEAS